ncbi:hypothetical protein AM500_14250 [Bacillus sp. FJAT-18017]|uniref:hypothetical protein n=1 Tax=Bacillus sp. FJAT-18017 TaxID=1705566 RepID=UPI0006ADCD5D|nr:hypothetical protein [Bacillus sp. FJAT-18017]ALC90821.1 hypothetical protein AM500_14250 [Bacillus sp. FJAT-18017]
MFYHLAAALLFWTIGLLVPPPSEILAITMILMGFVAFLFFLQECLGETRSKLLKEAIDSESKTKAELSSFSGRYVGIRSKDSPFPDSFSYIVFFNGEVNVPLFCRNQDVVKKLEQLDEGTDVIVYYSDYILLDVAEYENARNTYI